MNNFRNIAKPVFAAALLIMAGALAATAQTQVTWKVAGQDAPPFATKDASGNIVGIAVDVINAVAKDQGAKVDFQIIQQTDLIPSVMKNKIDIISSNLPINATNQAQVTFSSAYFTSGDGLVVSKSDTKAYKTVADLKGMTVGMLMGSGYLPTLQMQGFMPTKLIDTNAHVLDAVNSGQVQAAIGNNTSYAYLIKQRYPNLMLVPSYQSCCAGPYGIAVNKSNADLLNKINASLAKLEADGTVKGIFAKYGVDWTKPN